MEDYTDIVLLSRDLLMYKEESNNLECDKMRLKRCIEKLKQDLEYEKLCLDKDKKRLKKGQQTYTKFCNTKSELHKTLLEKERLKQTIEEETKQIRYKITTMTNQLEMEQADIQKLAMEDCCNEEFDEDVSNEVLINLDATGSELKLYSQDLCNLIKNMKHSAWKLKYLSCQLSPDSIPCDMSSDEDENRQSPVAKCPPEAVKPETKDVCVATDSCRNVSRPKCATSEVQATIAQHCAEIQATSSCNFKSMQTDCCSTQNNAMQTCHNQLLCDKSTEVVKDVTCNSTQTHEFESITSIPRKNPTVASTISKPLSDISSKTTFFSSKFESESERNPPPPPPPPPAKAKASDSTCSEFEPAKPPLHPSKVKPCHSSSTDFEIPKPPLLSLAKVKACDSNCSDFEMPKPPSLAKVKACDSTCSDYGVTKPTTTPPCYPSMFQLPKAKEEDCKKEAPAEGPESSRNVPKCSDSLLECSSPRTLHKVNQFLECPIAPRSIPIIDQYLECQSINRTLQKLEQFLECPGTGSRTENKLTQTTCVNPCIDDEMEDCPSLCVDPTQNQTSHTHRSDHQRCSPVPPPMHQKFYTSTPKKCPGTCYSHNCNYPPMMLYSRDCTPTYCNLTPPSQPVRECASPPEQLPPIHCVQRNSEVEACRDNQSDQYPTKDDCNFNRAKMKTPVNICSPGCSNIIPPASYPTICPNRKQQLPHSGSEPWSRNVTACADEPRQDYTSNCTADNYFNHSLPTQDNRNNLNSTGSQPNRQDSYYQVNVSPPEDCWSEIQSRFTGLLSLYTSDRMTVNSDSDLESTISSRQAKQKPPAKCASQPTNPKKPGRSYK